MQFSESIAKLIKEIKARNKQLKIRLEKTESEYIQQLENKDKEYKEAMTELELRLKEEMSDFNQLIKKYESKQRQRNIEMVQFVTDIMQRLDKCIQGEQPDEVTPPKLISRDVDDQELKDLFGHIDMKTVIDVKIISSFSTNKSRVVTTVNDQAWLWTYGVSLVTSDGKIVQNIRTDFKVFDDAVTTSGDLLMTERKGNKVKKITDDIRIEEIYTAGDNYETRGITVTNTGNVLVVLSRLEKSRIVEITTSGQQIRTIQHDAVINKQLFDQPRLICTNINGDIIVTDDA
ncbi:hypothetical protein KUTeg_011447 [Tegillarca granosa]|uniref:Uncharacterized protein n=1 Tax=Tegillarca granosa TaxID=220873 RepID=A0ABQ9F0T6_TEGGR|nr:hypothetical protein KUTeg_011447 [Tegillarca granosa]